MRIMIHEPHAIVPDRLQLLELTVELLIHHFFLLIGLPSVSAAAWLS